MLTYAEQRRRKPDFRVRYRWIDEQSPSFHQKPFQHMRCDFSYESDDGRDGLYMIWPEFEDAAEAPLAEGSPIPAEGIASMWIIVPDMREQVHRRKARVGVRGFFMVGGTRIAEAEIVQIVGLYDAHP
jgi:hypothetical protein